MQSDPAVAEDLYVVESIIGKKVVNGKLYYRVKWEGYPESDSTWEKPAHLRYVADMVKDYERTLSLSTDHPDTSDQHPALPLTTLSLPAPSDEDPYVHTYTVQQEQSSKEEQEQPITPRKLPQERECTQEKGERKPTRSSLKDKKRKKKTEDRKEDAIKPQACPRSQKKETKRLKKLRKEEENYRTPVVSLQGQDQKDKKDKQGVVVVKREESDVRIRLIVSEDDSDIRDYVVQYPTGTICVLDTCKLFYTHPVEFVGYLEKRTALRRSK